MDEWSLVLQFANTRLERPDGLIDRLADQESATRWLAEEFGWPTGPILTEADYAVVRRLRDAVRDLLRVRIASGEPSPADLAVLNDCSATLPRIDQLTPEWQRTVKVWRQRDHGPVAVRARCARLAIAAIDLLGTADLDLAECAADDCVALFARTDPRQQFHSVRCGNRMRAARSYARRRQHGP